MLKVQKAHSCKAVTELLRDVNIVMPHLKFGT